MGFKQHGKKLTICSTQDLVGDWKMKRVLIYFLICCLFLLVLSIPLASEQSSPQSTDTSSAQPQSPSTNTVENTQKGVITFCIEPSNLIVKVGDIFNVTVVAEDIPVSPGIAGAEFHVSWNSTVLSGLSIIRVLFQDNSLGWDEINNTEGLLSYVHASGSLSLSGNQTLGIITFEAMDEGVTTLHFTRVDACSPDAVSLESNAVDSSVTVKEGSGTISSTPSNEPPNVLYTMTIVAGSAAGSNALVLPPAVATENVPFCVNVEIINVANMAGWEFGLSWNSSVLNCTQAIIHNPDTWQRPISVDGEINNNFNSSCGRYHIAVAVSTDEAYTGNITIATLTFDPVGTGTTPLTFDSVNLCNADIETLTFTTTTGSISVGEAVSP